MKKFVFALAVIFFQGCLIFHSVSYEISLKGPTDGTAVITIHDIRSDAETELMFEEDKHNLFEFALKSREFKQKMETEGKELMERKLFNRNDTLVGKIEYTFNDIGKIENIIFRSGFYYLQLAAEDSVISTNGEILSAGDKKMIVWDRSFNKLKFELFSTSFSLDTSRKLLPYLD